MEAILDPTEYSEFEKRVDILKQKGVSLDHSVQEHDGRFIVLLNKEYDLTELDKLTGDL
tara:strand:- start:387 stop:563 length:177 start_codon:yes stop_codon:yes gene_type:complete